MATNNEIRILQTSFLFKLLKLQKRLLVANSQIDLKDLRDLIIEARATMTQEEVAWVQKEVDALD